VFADTIPQIYINRSNNIKILYYFIKMLRTVCSSFLFLFPIYLSHKKQDTIHLFLYTVAMGISIANHSHTFNKDFERRKIVCLIDTIYMHSFAAYLLFYSIYKKTLDKRITCFMVLLNYYIFRQLGDDYIEGYNETQKNIHVIFHLTGIYGLTISRFGLKVVAYYNS